MSLTLYAPGPLKATADPRVKSGLLLPYSEFGITSKGKVMASAGALKLAEKARLLTLEHSDKLGVAEFEGFEELEDGLHCSVRYLDTPLGNAALAEFDAGTRSGLSVEVDDPVIRAGKLMGGIIGGGSQVETPAFPSARLAAAELGVAPDEGETSVTIDGEKVAARVEITTVKPEPAPEPEAEPANLAASEPKETEMPAVSVQNAALVAAQAPKDTSASKLFATFAEAGRTRMNAALSDIVPADVVGMADTQPQYVGELWSGRAYERRIIPLFNHASLTSFKIAGWKWTTKPEVAAYAGNKTQIPSNAVETEPAEVEATRIAGGHDIDRKYRDFSNSEWWEAYFRAMTESYARVSDETVAADIMAAATPVTHGTVPSGVAAGLVYVVDGALAILDATKTVADFALVATDLWRTMLFTRADDALVYLNAALGFEDGTAATFRILPEPSLDPGTVLVGCKAAATVHELPGSPIRVEAIDVAKGGIDSALFGYLGTNVHDAEGLALVA